MAGEWLAPTEARGRRLTRGRRSSILPSAGAKSPAGIGVPSHVWPHRPLDRGFFVRVVQHPSYGRLDGGLFGGAGVQACRYANAVQSPTLIGVGVGGGDLYVWSLIMAGTLSHAAYCGTPEELFTIRPEAEAGLPIDALLCALSRARAVLAIASGQFNDPAAPRWTDSIISSALWSVEGDLSLIEQMVRYGWETEEASHG